MSYNIIVIFSFVFQNSVKLLITENMGGEIKPYINEAQCGPSIYIRRIYV